MKNEADSGARMKERLPSAVHALWGFFAAAGIPAWIVGGCVRDLLLGRSFADVDFVADAPAEAILALVEHWGKNRFGRFEGTLVGKPPAEGSRGETASFHRKPCGSPRRGPDSGPPSLPVCRGTGLSSRFAGAGGRARSGALGTRKREFLRRLGTRRSGGPEGAVRAFGLS